MLVARQFLESLIEKYGKHSVYSDGGTWYPEACKLLGLKQYLHSPLEKSLIERMMQYFKDRTESFDDYYPCNSKEIVIMVMAITGYNYLYQCTIIR